MDVFSKKKRSEIMSKIRSKDTKIEKLVFRELRKNKIYFQKHYRKAPGNPDIALPRKKKAVFIDGDFWHGYRYPTWKHELKTDFWTSKIENNLKRDKRNRAKLRRHGWKIMSIWEHDLLKRREKTMRKIIKFLISSR